MEQKNISSLFRRFPNALDFVVMAMWVFIAQMLTVYLCTQCGLEFPDLALANSADDQVSLWTQLAAAQSLAVIYPIAMTISLAGILLYRHVRGGTSKIASFSLAGFDPSRLLGLFILILAVQVVIEPLTMLMPEVPDMVGRGFFTLLVSVVFAPIFEEFICRGVILESFREKYGIWAGWICSSLFFGVIHGQVTAMFNASIIGLILGYAYIRSNSIFSAIILHALNNGLALALISFGLGDSTFRDIIPSTEMYWTVWGIALLITLTGSVIMVRNIHRCNKAR
ncbi:MAG: CPBP family intramembrane metalloprotease [Alistipes sp.]|nr:CPBP family intramembrane metalloprotease [Alistipes sp.]